MGARCGRRCIANAERGRRRHTRLIARIAAQDSPRTVVDSLEPLNVEITTALSQLLDEDAALLLLWAWGISRLRK
jgi:RNA polymerase sigma-70 factor (ECF subfamily)